MAESVDINQGQKDFPIRNWQTFWKFNIINFSRLKQETGLSNGDPLQFKLPNEKIKFIKQLINESEETLNLDIKNRYILSEDIVNLDMLRIKTRHEYYHTVGQFVSDVILMHDSLCKNSLFDEERSYIQTFTIELLKSVSQISEVKFLSMVSSDIGNIYDKNKLPKRALSKSN